MSLFSRRKVAAAVRTEADFQAALNSEVDVVFMHGTNLLTLDEQIERAHNAGKKLFIHMDFAEGIGKDRYGLEFLAKQGVDGILTTRTNVVKAAKEYGLITVQRFFIVDSHSLGTSVDSIKICQTDHTAKYEEYHTYNTDPAANSQAPTN